MTNDELRFGGEETTKAPRLQGRTVAAIGDRGGAATAASSPFPKGGRGISNQEARDAEPEGQTGRDQAAGIASATRLYIANHHGDTVLVVAESGAIESHLQYDAFGSVTAREGSFTPSYTFSTKEHLPGANLYAYACRVCYPHAGCWTQRDPIDYQDSVNLYQACDNSPAIALDLTDASQFGRMIDCSAETKNALEVGSAPMSFLYDRAAFPRTISLAGYWGSTTHQYYHGYQEYFPFSLMPRHYPCRFMDPTYIDASDGMVPYFSACASDIGDERYLVHSYDKQKGMCHSNTLKGNPWIDPLYRENSMLVGNANRHGMYHTVTNILEGGDVRNMLYTEPVPQQIGALCLLVDVPRLSEFRYHVFADRNQNEWQAWKQDVDPDVGNGIPGIAATERPYQMFFAPGGVYNVFARCVVARQEYSPFTVNQGPFTLVEYTSSRVPVVITGGRLDANNTPIMLYWEPYEQNDQ